MNASSNNNNNNNNSAMTNQNNDKNLLSLANRFGIEMNNGMSQLIEAESNNGLYTSYRAPKSIRRVYDAHKLDGQIKWTEPNFSGNYRDRSAEYLFTKAEDGSIKELSNIEELRGIIVSYQQRDELRYYDGEKSNNLCSVLGYKQNGKLVKDLPSQPYGIKYSFKQDPTTRKWSVDTTTPSSAVKALDLVGKRGERPTSCAECIKNGLSTEKKMINGVEKVVTCEPRGKMFLAVFEVSHKGRMPNPEYTKGSSASKFITAVQTIPVSNILDSEENPIGQFFFIEIPMSKTSIQGSKVKDANGKTSMEDSIIGYETFCKNLFYTYKDDNSHLTNSIFHYVSLTFKQNPYAPTFQANFSSLGLVNSDQFEAAFEKWESEAPEKVVQELVLEQNIAEKVVPVTIVDNPSLHSRQINQIPSSTQEEDDTSNLSSVSNFDSSEEDEDEDVDVFDASDMDLPF